MQELNPRFHNFLGVRYFFPPEGKIVGISGLDQVKKSKHLNHLELNAKIGDKQLKINNHSNRAGTIICSGKIMRKQ